MTAAPAAAPWRCGDGSCALTSRGDEGFEACDDGNRWTRTPAWVARRRAAAMGSVRTSTTAMMALRTM